MVDIMVVDSMAKKDDFVVRYTNKDIIEKLDALDKKIDTKIAIASSFSKRAMITATGVGILSMAILAALLNHLNK